MLNSDITWLILANTGKAEIYKIIHEDYSLIETLDSPQSRLKSQDLTSDRPGHYKTDYPNRGAFDSSDAHEEIHKNFAKEIAHFLETGQQNNQYHNIILCAEPHFHGLLNHVIAKPVRERIIKTIEKEYIPFPKPKIASVIKDIIHETKV